MVPNRLTLDRSSPDRSPSGLSVPGRFAPTLIRRLLTRNIQTYSPHFKQCVSAHNVCVFVYVCVCMRACVRVRVRVRERTCAFLLLSLPLLAFHETSWYYDR